MLTWLSANLSTLLISLVLFAVVISIVRYLIRQKKQGKHTCGCSGGCAVVPAAVTAGGKHSQKRTGARDIPRACFYHR